MRIRRLTTRVVTLITGKYRYRTLRTFEVPFSDGFPVFLRDLGLDMLFHKLFRSVTIST